MLSWRNNFFHHEKKMGSLVAILHLPYVIISEKMLLMFFFTFFPFAAAAVWLFAFKNLNNIVNGDNCRRKYNNVCCNLLCHNNLPMLLMINAIIHAIKIEYPIDRNAHRF